MKHLCLLGALTLASMSFAAPATEMIDGKLITTCKSEDDVTNRITAWELGSSQALPNKLGKRLPSREYFVTIVHRTHVASQMKIKTDNELIVLNATGAHNEGEHYRTVFHLSEYAVNEVAFDEDLDMDVTVYFPEAVREYNRTIRTNFPFEIAECARNIL